MNKIVIHVDGGVVQNVYAEDPDTVKIVVVDEDNLRENFDRDEREEIVTNETEGLKDTFVHVPDAQEEKEGLSNAGR